MFKDYPKLVRVSLRAYNILLKAKHKRNISMAELLSEYIQHGQKNDNYFFNWLRDYSKEKKGVGEMTFGVEKTSWRAKTPPKHTVLT